MTNSSELCMVIQNDHAHSLFVILEPWAEEFEIAPTEKIKIMFSTSAPRQIPVHYGPNTVTITCLEDNATVTVWSGERQLF